MTSIIIVFVILIFSAIIHEVSHGVVAEWLGDDTARRMGRITLNPIPHIDPIGTILVPILLYIGTGGRFWLGAAKPVPVNFDALRPRRLGMALVSAAGPASNFILAILVLLVAKVSPTTSYAYPVLIEAGIINIMLGVFNLIPIPPLDGSKIVASILPEDVIHSFFRLERWGFILVLIFVYFGWLYYILVPVLVFAGRIFGIDLLSAIQ